MDARNLDHSSQNEPALGQVRTGTSSSVPDRDCVRKMRTQGDARFTPPPQNLNCGYLKEEVCTKFGT